MERELHVNPAATDSCMAWIFLAYENESYDYPTRLEESVSEISGSVAHQISFWAAAATKGLLFY